MISPSDCRIPSTKTRIETRWYRLLLLLPFQIAEYLPLKQGLKLFSFFNKNFLRWDCRIPSTKTRIETIVKKSLSHFLNFYCRIPSTKTRIETAGLAVIFDLFQIAEYLPLKQGLKPKFSMFIPFPSPLKLQNTFH